MLRHARPACTGTQGRSYELDRMEERVAEADRLLQERTFPPDHPWVEAIGNERRQLILAQYVPSNSAGQAAQLAHGPTEPMMLRQSSVDLRRDAHQQVDLLVHIGSFTKAELQRISATQPLSVYLDGAGLILDLLAGSSPGLVHANYPVLPLSIELLEADTRGLLYPPTLTVQTVYKRGGTPYTQQWCQGRARLFVPSTQARRGGGGSGGESMPWGGSASYVSMERGALAADVTVQGSSLDGHALLSADHLDREPRVVYAAPLHLLLLPSIRTMLSIDFDSVRRKLSGCIANVQQVPMYRLVVGAENATDPDDEAGWMAVHMLSSMKPYMMDHGIPTSTEEFMYQNNTRANCIQLPCVPTDGLLGSMEEQCRQYEMCIARDTPYMRVSLHSTATTGTWQTTDSATRVDLTVRLRLTYVLVPRSLQARASVH